MSDLAGTGALIRLALRRDRIVLPVWILAVVALTASTASAFEGLYDTTTGRLQFAATIESGPVFRALAGRVFDGSTTGGLTAWRLGGLAAVMLALMSVFNVVRHTRAEEESGRLELLGSTVVGRRAPLAAAIVVMVSANLVAGIVTGLVLVGLGSAAAGSFAFGLGIAGAGVVFGAIAAIAAQLAETSRTALSIGSGAVIVAFVLRAVADASADSGRWLSWLSPIGWAQQVRAFAENRWWVLVLMYGAAIACVVVSIALTARRDLGAGLLAASAGPSEGAPGLNSVGALTTRLQRGPLIAWLIGFAVMGGVFGALGNGIGDLVDTSPAFEKIFEQLGGSTGIENAYFGAIFGLMALGAAAYGVSSTLRLRSEESAGRAEPLLSGGASRIQWATSHLAYAIGGPALLMAAAGTSSGLSYGLSTGHSGRQIARMVASALSQLPAIWVMVGVTLLIFGAVPRMAMAAWGVLAAFLLVGQIGATLQFPQVVLDLSPFTHSPKLPGAELSATAVVSLLVVAGLLMGLGLGLLRRRDIG